MIISRARRYVFVHIPKTGGTAMARALERHAAADDILIGDTPEARRRGQAQRLTGARGRLWKHATLADIDGLVTRQELAAFLTFTLVRNPWDRLVSYYHWLTDQSFAHPAVSIARETDFSGFLNHPMTRRAIAANSYQSYMRDADGLLHDPVYVRLERLDTDLAPVHAHLGFVPRPERINASARDPDWRRYYTAADAALVCRLCAGDIARFGYAF